MELFIKSIPILASLTLAVAVSLPVIGNIDLIKDNAQYQACKSADPSTTFAGIRYGDGPPQTVQYNQCVPWRKNGQIIANAVFCQPATCYVFSDEHCLTGPTTPVPVVVPIPVDFLNAADFVELLGQSAYCSPNTIPRVLDEHCSSGPTTPVPVVVPSVPVDFVELLRQSAYCSPNTIPRVL